MLPARYSLHDVDDVEQFAVVVLANFCTRTGTFLQPEDRDDAVQFLIAECWRFSEAFDPVRAGGTSFSSLARARLSQRAVDWMRSRLGRSRWVFNDHVHERERPVPLSLDAPHEHDTEHGSLGESLAGSDGNPEGRCDPSLAAIVAAGGRERAEDLRIVRELDARLAAERDRERERRRRAA
jgi:hypothetical protein